MNVVAKRRQLLASGGAMALVGFTGASFGQVGDGYFVPSEDAPHQRTFMQWPVSRKVYGDAGFLHDVQHTIADIANAIAEFEQVTLLASQEDHAHIRTQVTSRVEIWDIPTEDLWCRDSGPIFATNKAGDLAISHIQFNGWGEKQTNHRDSQIARRVAERLGVPLLQTGLRGEGGGVEHDGHGLLIAHESSWLNDNRNPGMSLDDITKRLLSAYGASRLIWSPGVSGEDITDYHIDSLARLTGPGRVLINLPDDPDPNDQFHAAGLETHDILHASGLEIEVIPDPLFPRVKSRDFVASYVNFYVFDGAVVAAQFGDRETDEIAAETLSRHFPDRDVILLNVDPLGVLGGGIHCATQQMPAV